jgi:hypothetical protein
MKKILIGASALACASASMAGQSIIGYSISSNGDDHLYEINFSSGIATDLGLVGLDDGEGMAMGANGTIYAVGGTVPELWDVTTPPGSLIGATSQFAGIDSGMDMNNSDGMLYVVSGNFDDTSLYTVDPTNGTTNLVGAGVYFGDNLAISDSGVAYATDWIFNNATYTVDLATGSATLVGALGFQLSQQAGSDFATDGNLYVLLGSGEWYTIDTGTGAATLGGTIRDAAGAPLTGFEGLAMNPVPEPATYAGMGIGIVILALARRRRN